MVSFGKHSASEGETSTETNASGFYMELPVYEDDMATQQEIDNKIDDSAVIIDYDYLGL